MRFQLIDQVEQLEPRRIIAVKQVSAAEEYLADHFPTFPVLPGVMMLEACVQAGMWLLHQSTDFSRSLCVLKLARNVRYGHFVAPGMRLRVDVSVVKQETRDDAIEADCKAVGTAIDSAGVERQALTGRLTLAYFNVASRAGADASMDARLIGHARQRWNAMTATAPVALGNADATGDALQ